MPPEKLRQIPSIDELKSSPKGMDLARTYGEKASLRSIRIVQGLWDSGWQFSEDKGDGSAKMPGL